MRKFSPQNIRLVILALYYTLVTCGQAVIRSKFGKLTRTWCDRELQIWSKRMIKLLKIKYTIINPNKITPKHGKPTIIICNHASHIDIPLSFSIFPKHSIRMLAKQELAKIPIFGQAARASEMPFISRGNLKKAIHDLKALENLMKSGIVVWIYAEGTRSKTGQLQPLKKGGFITAIQTKATIIPIYIRGTNKILPAQSSIFKLNQQVDLMVGDSIDAAEYSLENKEALIEKTYQSMLKLSNS